MNSTKKTPQGLLVEGEILGGDTCPSRQVPTLPIKLARSRWQGWPGSSRPGDVEVDAGLGERFDRK